MLKNDILSGKRLPELSPPHEPLSILVELEWTETIKDFLIRRNWTNIEVVSEFNQISSLSQSDLSSEPPSLTNILWRPNPLAEMSLRHFPAQTSLILDVGSGFCRDAIYFCLNGHQVICLDQRAELMQEARDIAKRLRIRTLDFSDTTIAQLDEKIQLVTVTAKIGRNSGNLNPAVMAAERIFRRRHFDVVHVSRFFLRDLVPVLFDLVSPEKGLLVYHHFMEGSSRPVGTDKVLQPNELAKIAEKKRFELILDQTMELEDNIGKRILSLFIARSPSAYS